MRIVRANFDFGNSGNNFMFDGHYFEFPTNFAEISKEEAESYFVGTIEHADEFLKRMLISTKIDNKERYFLIGEAAEKISTANGHIERMHNKIESLVPYACFLASIAYYHANEGEIGNSVEIDSMNMMLPIWLLTRADKFSSAQRKMEERFLNEHIVTIHTPGLERTLHITVHNAKCRIESEVARHAIKYKIVAGDENKEIQVIVPREDASEFNEYQTVLVDIGGGSTDAVLLGEGLSTPRNRDAFKVIDIEPFLGYLEEFRRQKLLGTIGNVRVLERLIVNNYEQQRYEFYNENTGDSVNLTNEVTAALRAYAKLLVAKVQSSFTPKSSDEVYKFIYFGGEAPILQPYIKEALLDHMKQQIADRHHYFLDEIISLDKFELLPPMARTLNITALEIITMNEQSKVTT